MLTYAVLPSTQVSLIVQLITGLLGVNGIMQKLPKEHEILRSILILETIVQVIEFLFYISFVLRYNLDTMASTRYFDWIFTTPTMLFTTMIFFKYEEMKLQNTSSQLTIKSFVKEYTNIIYVILFSNMLMLVFGYLGEIGIIDKYIAVNIGFVFFTITFYTLYDKFAKKSNVGKKIFSVLTMIWALYGVAFMFPIAEKNIMFNILDIIAKNFFGIFLWFIIHRYKVNI